MAKKAQEAVVEINPKQQFRVSTWSPEDGDQTFLSVRKFVVKKDGTWVPTNQGIMLPIEDVPTLTEELLAAIKTVYKGRKK